MGREPSALLSVVDRENVCKASAFASRVSQGRIVESPSVSVVFTEFV